MIVQLALRSLWLRLWRSLLLLAGFGLGVGVMIVLLSIGDAMVAQASDEQLVGGGSVTVLPEGVDIEVMRTGGIGGLWFSIPNARFAQRQVLAAPRLAPRVRTVAPQIEGKLLYLRTARGREIAIRATGEIPSASRAVGAVPPLVAGRWEDDADDRRWLAPSRAELLHDIDRFHETPAAVDRRSSWSEWHYFNVLSPDRRRWAFVTFMLSGDVPNGDWQGRVLLTLHEQERAPQRFNATVPARRVRYSTEDADLRLGDAGSVRVLDDGRYEIRARTTAESGGGVAEVNLVVTPDPQAYFPGVSLGTGTFVSGYVVPALRADASGTICVRGVCERYDAAQSYHDHNWGTWSGVTWEWGAARAGPFTLLYGRIEPPDSLARATPMLVYLVDSLGFRATFRPRDIEYTDGRTVRVDGVVLRVPSSARMVDVRGADTLELELAIEAASGTDIRDVFIERGDAGAVARQRPYFIQMMGTARLRGRVGGVPIAGAGAGFFETYR